MQALRHEARGLTSVRQSMEEEVTPMTKGCTCEVHVLIPLTAPNTGATGQEQGPAPGSVQMKMVPAFS